MHKQSGDFANVLGPTLVGGAGGGVLGALAGATYNQLLGKPQLFYDDVGRGALRGLLAGGGGGIGVTAAGSDPNAQRVGGGRGSLAGMLAGNILVRRNEDDDEYLARLQTGEKKKKKPKKYTRTAAEKQSKVYEASESVENMPIKQTKMNHKKCTPGEFGAMVKEAAGPVPTQQQPSFWSKLFPSYAERMRMGQKAMQKIMPPPKPLNVKSARDFGAMLLQKAAKNPLTRVLTGVTDALTQTPVPVHNTGKAINSVTGQTISGGASPSPSWLIANRDAAATAASMARSARSGAVPPPTPAPKRVKASSARDFGALVKQSFLDQYASKMKPYLPAIGTGLAAGAGLGAIKGLVSPGEEDEYDANGRVIGRKQRNRFGAMLQNALTGAFAGGAAGGAARYLAPGYTDAALQKMYGMFQQPRQLSHIQTPEEARLAAGKEYTGGPTPVEPDDQTVELNKREYLRRVMREKSTDRQQPPTETAQPVAPMSPNLQAAYGEEPSGPF